MIQIVTLVREILQNAKEHQCGSNFKSSCIYSEVFFLKVEHYQDVSFQLLSNTYKKKKLGINMYF